MKIGAVPGLSLVAAALLYSALPAGQDRAHILFENTIDKSGIDFVLANSATPDRRQVETLLPAWLSSTMTTTGFSTSISLTGAPAGLP